MNGKWRRAQPFLIGGDATNGGSGAESPFILDLSSSGSASYANSTYQAMYLHDLVEVKRGDCMFTPAVAVRSDAAARKVAAAASSSCAVM
jgi:hypothetical protein